MQLVNLGLFYIFIFVFSEFILIIAFIFLTFQLHFWPIISKFIVCFYSVQLSAFFYAIFIILSNLCKLMGNES